MNKPSKTIFIYVILMSSNFLICAENTSNITRIPDVIDAEWDNAHFLPSTQMLKIYRKAAERGDNYSQYKLGLHHLGFKDNKNKKVAFQWFKKAALQGNTNAQFYLGLCYELGHGTDIDKEKEFNWYEKAAKQGNSNAQFQLGIFYYEKKEYSNAVDWLEKAVMKDGAFGAQSRLGDCYAKGEGVVRNDAEAIKWYKKASYEDPFPMGAARLENKIAEYYEFGGVGLNQNKLYALKWYQRASDDGLFKATVKVARWYDFGIVADEHNVYALKLYRKAFLEGFLVASPATIQRYNSLIKIYKCNLNLDSSDEEWANWFKEKFKKMKRPLFAYLLGRCYHLGVGVEKDEKEAVEYYKKAAKTNLDAQCFLGKCYYEGIGVEKDEKEAEKWFKKAAEANHKYALWMLKSD